MKYPGFITPYILEALKESPVVYLSGASQTGQEVDFILEDRQGNCVGIEVKASATVRPDDFKGLKWLAEHFGKRFIRGLVLYTGKDSVTFGDRFAAYPIEILWNTDREIE